MTVLTRPLGNVVYFPYTPIFSVFAVSDGQWVSKPCEMSSENVIDFVLGFEPEQHSAGYLKWRALAPDNT